MNILVYDVAASTSGALAVLEDFYLQVKEYGQKDITWYFVISTPNLNETNNIKVLKYPWVKKSWGHRYFFENSIIQKILRKYEIDYIFSMQNMIIPRTKIKQSLYVHFPFVFTKYKFQFKENKVLWFYQNVLCYRIYRSIRKSNKVIVQTEWMKKACIEKTKCDADKIEIIKPVIELVKSEEYKFKDSKGKTVLFYPATAFEYKKHFDILYALKEIKDKGISNFKTIFTIEENTNDYSKKIREYIDKNKLDVDLVGNMKRNDVFKLYSNSVLVFPSEVESYGMPLLEARIKNAIIIAKRMPFSEEILIDYKNGYFYRNVNELVDFLLKLDDIPHKYESMHIDNHRDRLVENIVTSII